MAAEKRGLFHVFRMSRKLALLSGVFLLVLGASGTAALVLAPAHLLPGYSEETVSSCKTLYQSEFRRGREERLIAVISTDAVKPADRVRIGMRLARHLVETSKPDLVIVQVVDHQGPTGRAEIRGPVVGAEIAHAPNPPRRMPPANHGRRDTSMHCRPVADFTSGPGSTCDWPIFKPLITTSSLSKAATATLSMRKPRRFPKNHPGIDLRPIAGKHFAELPRSVRGRLLKPRVQQRGMHQSARVLRAGNRITSRIEGASVNSITSRSTPIPKPPAGGIP